MHVAQRIFDGAFGLARRFAIMGRVAVRHSCRRRIDAPRADGGHLKIWNFGARVDLIQRQQVGGRFGEVEGEEEGARWRTSRNQGAAYYGAAARFQLQPIAGDHAQVARVLRVQFDDGVWEGFVERRRPRHRAAVPVEEHAPGRQVVGVFLVRLLALAAEIQRPEFTFAAREGVFKEVGRAGMIEAGAGPMNAALALQPFVGDAEEIRRERAHLLPDFFGVCVIEARALRAAQQGFRSPGEIADDLPIGARFADGRQGAAYALYAAVGIGEGAIFFGKAGGGQDDIRHIARLILEDVDADKQVQHLEGVLGMSEIRLGHHRVFAKHDHGLDAAIEGAIDHLGDSEAGNGGQGRIPLALEARADIVVIYTLVGGEDVGQAAAIRAALDVVLPAQGIEAGAFAAEVARHQRQVGQREGVVGAVRALADAHAPIAGGPLGGGVNPRGLADVLGWYAAQLFRPFWCAFFERFDVILEILSAPRDEIGVE